MTTTKGKKRRKLLVFAVVAVVLLGAGAYAYFSRPEAVITIQTEKVRRGNLTELVVASGKIQPVVFVKISPEVSGEITELPVKEGQWVNKGDLLLKIKPDSYVANSNIAKASFNAAQAQNTLAKANLDKAEAEYKRADDLFRNKYISDSQFLEMKTGFHVAKASFESSQFQMDNAKAGLARAVEDLAKTTVTSPLSGTISKLNSQLGERVVGTAMYQGTEVMTISDLRDMEARVDVSEIDVVLIQVGQKTRLEVDSFRDRKFTGLVSEIANTAKASGLGSQQEATKFEVRIRILEKEPFRPGMSVTAEIETRTRTNVLTVPIQSVTVRVPKEEPKKTEPGKKSSSTGTNTSKPAPAATGSSQATNRVVAVDPATAANPATSNGAPANASTNASASTSTNTATATKTATESRKPGEGPKPVEVVFVVDKGRVRMAKVTRGISDDTNVEIKEGVTEGDEIVSGGYKAINRDLEDGKAAKVDNTKRPLGEIKDESLAR